MLCKCSGKYIDIYFILKITFQYSAPRLYNKLPVVIEDSENINQFKKRLKTYLFGESYDMNQKTINEQYKM